MKKYIVAGAAIVIAGIGLYLLYVANNTPVPVSQTPEVTEQGNQNGNQPPVATTTTNQNENNGTTTEAQVTPPENKEQTTVGKSAGGRDIIAYNFGTGTNEILLVGGIHGGYSWNTALLAYQLMDYLKSNPSVIPANIKVTVIPVLNPDGLGKVVSVAGPFSTSDVSTSKDLQVAGRFNANNVDLNRNFDCGWKAQGVWQNKTVSGGTSAFSEPEAAAIRDYAQAHKITAVVAWYSSGGGVYSSSCNGGILPDTQTITDLYAKASGYAAHKNFESYQVSGDMTDWFAKNSVPAIGVLLTTANDTELSKNEAGIKAIFSHYVK